jgi:hypothetical protein
MSLKIITYQPGALLLKIRRGIENNIVEHWTIEPEGRFSCNSEDQYQKAFFRPEIGRHELLMGIMPSENVELTPYIYSFYHSKFIEMLIYNFEKEFIEVSASALRKAPDVKEHDKTEEEEWEELREKRKAKDKYR